MTIEIFDQVIMLFGWLILLLLLQLSIWPFLKALSEEFALPLSFPISLLLSTLVSWYLAFAGLPVHLTMVIIVILIGYAIGKGTIGINDIRAGGWWYTLFYGTFLLTLGVHLWYNSAIDISYEKLLDSMILSSMIYNPTIPPMDAWYVGGSLSWYYYLGSWMFAVPAVILSIPASVMYGFVIPTIFATSVMMVYCCSTLVLTKFRYIPLFLFFISYPGFFIFIPVALSNNSPFRFILDGTVRLIPGAVTENPLTALFIGSPRPYAIALMIQCAILFLLIFLFTKWKKVTPISKVSICLLLSLCLGTLVPLHTWDFVVFLPLTMFIGLLLSIRFFYEHEEKLANSTKNIFFNWLHNLRARLFSPSIVLNDNSVSAFFLLFLLMPVISLVLYLPFLLMAENQRMQGITLFVVPSELIPFLLVHGFFIFLLLVYLYKDIIKRPVFLLIPVLISLFGFISVGVVLIPAIYLFARKFGRIEEILAFTGLICLICCDFFAIVLNGVPDRANTTYKFYFTAWVLLGVSTFILIGEMLSKNQLFCSEKKYKVVSIVLIICALVFPVTLLSSGPLWPPSLDGTAFVNGFIGPEEVDAIAYLRSLPKGNVLIEGVVPMGFDEDNTAKYFSRISAYTGIPAVMGSFSRENAYRGNEITRIRGEDSVLIYVQPDRAAELMAKHNATLLYVGIPEIMVYQIKDPGIFARFGFLPVFHENSTVIWRPPYRQV